MVVSRIRNKKDLKEYMSIAMSKSVEILDGEVQEIVANEMIKNLDKYVYKVYNPISYTRRNGSWGSMKDDKMIEGTMVSSSYDTSKPTARFQNISVGENSRELLTPLVVLGRDGSYSSPYVTTGYDWWRTSEIPENETPYWYPRDFITPTRNALSKKANRKKIAEGILSHVRKLNY